MDFLPFEIYLSTLDIEEYGVIYEIPNYFSEEELESCNTIIQDNSPLQSGIYPNMAIDLRHLQVNNIVFEKELSEKTRIMYEYYDDILAHSKSLQNKCKYVPEFDDKAVDETGKYILKYSRERIQGSPKGMKPYPTHSDGGKSLTCIVPLSPVKSVPTQFDGIRGRGKPVNLGWEINKAYMFIPNDTYSYHSYEGDKDHDRWIANINFYTKKSLDDNT